MNDVEKHAVVWPVIFNDVIQGSFRMTTKNGQQQRRRAGSNRVEMRGFSAPPRGETARLRSKWRFWI